MIKLGKCVKIINKRESVGIGQFLYGEQVSENVLESNASFMILLHDFLLLYNITLNLRTPSSKATYIDTT